MISAAMKPPGQGDSLAGVSQTKIAATVRFEHDVCPLQKNMIYVVTLYACDAMSQVHTAR